MPISFTGKGTPITGADFQAAAATLGGDAASLWSLVVVETSGFGYLPDRRPQILFERHIFHRLTNGAYDQAYPDISNPTQGGYSGGAAEYPRLQRAMALNESAALQSASWGLGQVMGFNAAKSGYTDVHAMVSAMVASEGAQLRAIAGFIAGNPPLLASFRTRNWAKVAFYYNGSNYAANHYDAKLEQHYQVFHVAANQPALDLRTAQACLLYLKFHVGGIDGLQGPSTRAAMLAYRAAKGIDAAVTDADVMTRLRTDADI
jgi:hypothetical protein